MIVIEIIKYLVAIELIITLISFIFGLIGIFSYKENLGIITWALLNIFYFIGFVIVGIIATILWLVGVI